MIESKIRKEKTSLKKTPFKTTTSKTTASNKQLEDLETLYSANTFRQVVKDKKADQQIYGTFEHIYKSYQQQMPSKKSANRKI